MTLSVAEKYAKIAELVNSAEPHRNAEKREAWRQIVGIVNDEEVTPRTEEAEVAEDISDGGGDAEDESRDETVAPARRVRTSKD